jgi:hypothetical protein
MRTRYLLLTQGRIVDLAVDADLQDSPFSAWTLYCSTK